MFAEPCHVLLALLTALLIADYGPFWGRREPDLRSRTGNWRSLLRSGVFLVLAAALLLPRIDAVLAIAVVSAALLHLVADAARAFWTRARQPRPFTAELAGLALMVVAAIALHMSIRPVREPVRLPWLASDVVRDIGIALAAVCLLTQGGALLVRGFFDEFIRPDESHAVRDDELRVGRFIGILERLLIAGLAVGGQFGAIGFVLAAKSIARFKEMDKRAFAEYYLIGTLLSVLIALIVGWAFRTVMLALPRS